MNFVDIEKNAPKVESTQEYSIRYAQVAVKEIKGRIIRNPGYNDQKVSLNGWCWHSEVSRARKPQFMEALRDSIREAGIRNPVVLYALSEGCFLSFGGSRVLAARSVGLESIPAIVNDYTGRFAGCPEVTEQNYAEYFTDVPKWVAFGDHGFDTHYFMERNRRGSCDPSGYAWMPQDADWVSQEFPWLMRDN